ncbi:MAG: general stress protein CsbD, partial [Galbibacter orientalis]
VAEGKFDEMLGRVQEKTGKTKEELREEFENL